MESNSGFPEKLDALDLIINALTDHEKKLDEISQRLESLYGKLSIERAVEERDQIKEQQKKPSDFRKKLLVICNKWSEFKEVSRDSKIVAFEIDDNSFNVFSLVNEQVFKYSEDLPLKRIKISEDMSSFSIDKASLKSIESLKFLIDKKLVCGLRVSVDSSSSMLSEKNFLLDLSYSLDSYETKEFLTRELNISTDRIVEGKIT